MTSPENDELDGFISSLFLSSNTDSLWFGSDYGIWLSQKYQDPSQFPILPVSKSTLNVFIISAIRNVKCFLSLIFECLHIIITEKFDHTICKQDPRAHMMSSILGSYSHNPVFINPSSLGFSLTVQSPE